MKQLEKFFDTEIYLTNQVTGFFQKRPEMIRITIMLVLFTGTALFAQDSTPEDNPIAQFAWWFVNAVIYGLGGIFCVVGIIGLITGLMSGDQQKIRTGIIKFVGGALIFGAVPITSWLFSFWSDNQGVDGDAFIGWTGNN